MSRFALRSSASRWSGIKRKINESNVVAKGELKCGGITPCCIVIQKETSWPRSGDTEDTPEIAEDREKPCCSVWYESPSNKGSFNAGGGYYETVEEAIKDTKKKIQGPDIDQSGITGLLTSICVT